VIDANLVDEVRITVIATGFDQLPIIVGDPVAAQPERKRATQIAMPYLRPAPMAQPIPSVELKAQQAMREAAARPDATPVTQPMRADLHTAHATHATHAAPRAPAPAAEPKQQRLTPSVLQGTEETELDIPAFLRHPPRNLE
jgi:hypothetical protein